MRLYVKDSPGPGLRFTLASFSEEAEKVIAPADGHLTLLGIEHFDRVVIERRDKHYPNPALRTGEADRVILINFFRSHRNFVVAIVDERDLLNARRPRTGPIYNNSWGYHMAIPPYLLLSLNV